MKKLIYAIGVSLFLAFMAFHVTTSFTNPYWGASIEALAQYSGGSSAQGYGKKSKSCTCRDSNNNYCRTAVKCIEGVTKCLNEQGCFTVCPGCPGY